MRYDKTLPQLRIIQVNVARSPSPHEAALQLASEQDYHVILIQEPWVVMGFLYEPKGWQFG